MSQYSDSHFSEDPNSSWYKVYSFIKAGSLVLDVGCSSGNFGKVLIDEKSCIVDGIELDDSDYKMAKTKLRNVYKLNIETDDISFIKDKYDYIYFGDVIEHLVYPAKSLDRIKALLKPRGSVVFSIPNMSHISVRLMLLAGEFNYGQTGLLDDTHLHFYTFSKVSRVFSEAGYTISKLDPVLIDYPEELIQKELSKVGLKPTKEFIDFMSKTEASVYQFVGMAVSSKSSKNLDKLDVVSPADLFQKYLDETKNYYESTLESQAKHIAKLENKSAELNVLNNEYLTELNAIKNSKYYNAIKKLGLVNKKK
jgi:2-polyprenyl-3-methyl-5-hydroxy-6-metoxy-1,4-benzoquinol methylase